ncbi:hypothetical protein [Fulvivirga lutimaris]|uniref:hypothetical protein n=1 Tax=Fulvivirga lutimaris TaxID=1819566 RepID=UPI0012BD11FE|nr:hypothetical protein [Fulvivirga lutimaris]MTI39253.1 hypothetical protein [Fulvivirga lutimaris]
MNSFNPWQQCIKIVVLNSNMHFKLILLLLMLSSVGYGQTKTTFKEGKLKRWQVGLGYGNFRTFDKNVSPLIYRSNTGGLLLGFEKENKKTIWNIKTEIFLGSNQSKRHGKREAVIYDPYPLIGQADSTHYVLNPTLSFVHARLSFSYLREVDNVKSIPMFIGGKIENQFYYGAIGGDVWFFNQLGASLAGQFLVYRQGKSKVNLNVSIPIFSHLVRQPYSLDPSLPEQSYFNAYLKTGSEWGSLNKYQQFQLEGYYLHKSRLGLSYRFSWMRYNNHKDGTVRMYSNLISIIYSI